MITSSGRLGRRTWTDRQALEVAAFELAAAAFEPEDLDWSGRGVGDK